MHLDILASDVAQANAMVQGLDRSHNWHNPIAIALERRYGRNSAVVTDTMAHICGNGLIGRFELTDAAKAYLKAFREGRAWPVDRLEYCRLQSLGA